MAPGLMLALAILGEVTGTVALRLSDGLTRPLPCIVMALGYVTSFALLSIVVRQLPLGFAYAIWAGSGVALVAVVGVIAFGEHFPALKAFSLLLVICGVVGLNLAGGH